MKAERTFQEDVINAWKPIMHDYGYRLIESDDSYVRLDSANTSIQIRWDRARSFEIGVTFVQQENGHFLHRLPLNLDEIFRECGVPNASELGYLQTSDPARVPSLLASICRLLIDHCDKILCGDRVAFASVSERRAREAAAYTRQLQVASIREQADNAWHSKRYQEFIDLLGEFRSVLSDADKKKLEYATKKIPGSTTMPDAT